MDSVTKSLIEVIGDSGYDILIGNNTIEAILLAHTMDRLNERFGMHAVYLGGMHEARDSAPMRISFTNIPKLDPKEM